MSNKTRASLPTVDNNKMSCIVFGLPPKPNCSHVLNNLKFVNRKIWNVKIINVIIPKNMEI